MRFDRRQFLKAGAAGAALAGLAGCAANRTGPSKARVVVVGGGFGGATASKYIRMLDPSIEVVLVEPNEAFVSCPISNFVLGGFKTMAQITTPYSGLERSHGVQVVRDSASWIDTGLKQVRLANGKPIRYDRVIVAPGIDFMWETLPGMGGAEAQAKVLHAWKAGPDGGAAPATRGDARRRRLCPCHARSTLPLPAGAV
jgi:NADPH-dependent 2,4-dienoyl-CoA reductase/sulfur reductase-like enzyme